MSALKRVEAWLERGARVQRVSVGMYGDDLRAVLALAKEAGELKRRIRRVRVRALYLQALRPSDFELGRLRELLDKPRPTAVRAKASSRPRGRR